MGCRDVKWRGWDWRKRRAFYQVTHPVSHRGPANPIYPNPSIFHPALEGKGCELFSGAKGKIIWGRTIVIFQCTSGVLNHNPVP